MDEISKMILDLSPKGNMVEFLADRFDPARAGLIEAIADLDFIRSAAKESDIAALAEAASAVARLYLNQARGQ